MMYIRTDHKGIPKYQLNRSKRKNVQNSALIHNTQIDCRYVENDCAYAEVPY